MRPLAITLTICAAIACAGCTAWAQAKAKRDMEQFRREWGVPSCIKPNTSNT